MTAVCVVLGWSGMMLAQAAAKPAPAAKPEPLRLNSLAPDTVADPFPPVNLKFFTAETPSAATVDSYLHVMLGYDPNRIWRVVGIQKTAAPGVSRVTALVSEKTANAKVQQAVFFVTPDGQHLIADNSGVLPFGAQPFAADRAILQARANGPWHGAASKDLELVEFADLQCPHCKDAQTTMKRLATDFPQARVVYENLPLVDLHPFAERAALDGLCIAQKSNDAFFNYVDAVYETQSQLTPEAGDKTLNDAIRKAGADPAAITACAATPEAKAAVDASVRLSEDLGISQTPMLAINGRLISIGGIPYETLKEIVMFQASLDGVKLPLAAPLIK